ncbi:MAG TPA: extracellular solute-binding protein [Candidatus Binatia bacterium]|jgi:iron(III) transport system substrate-binding protein|nr:extracellular solute-binding protein [Candidatus Binatia bacterium]
MKRTTLLLFAALFIHCFFVRTPAIVAAEKPSWQLDWEKTLQAAKQEGQISIYAALGPYHPQIFAEFQKDYPEIKATVTHGSSNRISPRLFAERRAGKYLADTYLGGPTSLYSFYKNDLFDPLASILVLPEVVDTSLWWERKHFYIEPERKYIFINEGSVSGFTITYNTQLAKPAEFKSYWDLFQPKWKGKIVSLDARDPGFGASELRFLYYHPELGPEFIRRLFGEMHAVLSREHQQAINWVGAGKVTLCVFCRDGFASHAKAQGLPVDYINHNDLKEMPRLRGSASAITLVNKAPHPNAAKVFINWFLSRRGQIVYQDSHGDRDSLRTDIPKDKIPAAQRRLPDRKYFFVDGPEFIDVKPAVKIIDEALAGKIR